MGKHSMLHNVVEENKKHEPIRNPDMTEARANRISSEGSSAHFTKVFKEGKERELMKHYTGPTRDLREHILKMSLFPNIYNHKELLREF
jgi:hypothetical protein